MSPRLQQLRAAFSQTRQIDPRLVPILVAVGLGVFAVVAGLGVVAGYPVIGIAFGLLLGILAALLVFGQRSASAALTAIEDRPGAAAAVLQSMRGHWRVTPAVAYTRKQDFVHRAVGRPGVVMVGEGAPARVSSLLKQEHRRMARVVGDVPVHEVNVGTGAGQIPLKQLRGHLLKLPRAVKPAEVKALETRLAALQDAAPPLPKGPMPRAPRRG